MQDKSWLLKPAAITAAKNCIHAVQNELGVRLPLTHPEFLKMLNEYAELSGSEALAREVSALNAHAAAGAAVVEQRSAVVNLRPGAPVATARPVERQEPQKIVQPPISVAPPGVEMIHFNGRDYPKWQDGKQFAGLYRGQPRYV
jgi:hypothetical protein